MRVVHLCRKPLSEKSVAANVLEHGTGAIHIDASRIAAPGETIETHTRSPEASAKENRMIYGEYGPMETHQKAGQKFGRWPPNLILQHRPDCRCVGSKRVKGAGWRDTDQGDGSAGTALDGSADGSLNASSSPHYADADGMETVAAWECVPECPVGDLDRRSLAGGMHGAGRQRNKVVDGEVDASSYNMGGPRDMFRLGDVGGASRFFKQVQSMTNTSDIPQDLLDYLRDLILPPGGDMVISFDLGDVDWGKYKDEQLHALIGCIPLNRDPAAFMDEVWRVLKPGAHVCLFAPEEQPTGHTGACALEDRGFEIRDAILLVQEPGRVHYVPKANAKERHAGCEDLKTKRKERDREDQPTREDLEALGMSEEDIEEILAAQVEPIDLNSHKGNCHPTVKPKDVLVRLLSDVPPGATVLDPFMGSGSQGLACLETGHNYIGIEMDPDYLEIADHRIRHWDRRSVGDGATIESEAPERKEEREEVDMFDW